MGRLITGLLAISVLSWQPYAAHAAQGETRRSPGQEAALRKVQLMIRKLKAENARLQADNAQLQAELNKAQRGAGQLQKQVSRQRSQLAKSQQHGSALRDRITASHDRLRDVIDKFKALRAVAQRLDKENAELKGRLQSQGQQVNNCIDKNLRLYKTGLELLEHYEHKGVWDAMRQQNTLVGLKQVEIENLVEEYTDRLDELQVENKVAPAPR